VSLKEGEQLLRGARNRTGWNGQEASARQEQALTRLYDQRGTGSHDEARFKPIVEEADDELWLVPAIALNVTTGDRDSKNRPSPVPIIERLNCQDSGRVTDQQFETQESVPDETWTGQSIWECLRYHLRLP